ncbi:MAG TPA: 2TM domain-containing protein [Actinomycetes bacterium]|nr:2TM domain-containing protein [Actinomycetes bacterium]
MSSNVPARDPQADQNRMAEARRWVRRKRILYTILGIYAVLSLMWFLIDMADGTESLWFYWPMLGTGIAVAIAAVALLGVGGVLGTDWENRQIESYLKRHRNPDSSA